MFKTKTEKTTLVVCLSIALSAICIGVPRSKEQSSSSNLIILGKSTIGSESAGAEIVNALGCKTAENFKSFGIIYCKGPRAALLKQKLIKAGLKNKVISIEAASKFKFPKAPDAVSDSDPIPGSVAILSLDRTSGTAGVAAAAKALGGKASIGAGTVLGEREVDAVADVGGAFIVSPDCNEVVIAHTLARGLLLSGGVFTDRGVSRHPRRSAWAEDLPGRAGRTGRR